MAILEILRLPTLLVVAKWRLAGDLRRVIPLALSLLGPLPEGSGGDPTSLLLLACRQALALAVGRRQHLARLAARLGMGGLGPAYEPVPGRL